MTENPEETEWRMPGHVLQQFFEELIRERDGNNITPHRLQKYWDRFKDRNDVEPLDD